MAATKSGGGAKGNPAAHRMSNKALKERRAASWKRGQQRKAERVATQKRREAINKVNRELGEPTPWEAARAARLTRRRDERALAKSKIWTERET